jgi:hypothetical protein
MKVTVTMDQEMAAWARVEATRAGQSLSAWLGGQLARIRGEQSDFEADLSAICSTPRIAMSTGGRIFDRDEIYDS